MPEEEFETGELKESLDQRLEEHEHAEHAAHGGGGGGGHAASHASKPGASWTRYLSLSTAVIAVFAAVASLKSGANSNEAILAKSEAMLYQAEASDQWALYQAKSIKGTLSEDVDSLWSAIQAAGIKPVVPAGGDAAAPAPAGEAAKPTGDAAKTEAKPEDAAAKLTKLARLGEESKRYREEAKEIQDKAEKLEEKVKEANDESDGLMKHHERFAISVTLLQIAIALSAIAALTRLKPLWYLSMAVSVGGLIVFVIGWM